MWGLVEEPLLLLLTATDGPAMRSFRQVLGHFRPGAVHPKVSPRCKTGTYYTCTTTWSWRTLVELLIFPALHYLELEDLVELLIFLTWGPTLHYGLTLRGVAAHSKQPILT